MKLDLDDEYYPDLELKDENFTTQIGGKEVFANKTISYIPVWNNSIQISDSCIFHSEDSGEEGLKIVKYNLNLELLEYKYVSEIRSQPTYQLILLDNFIVLYQNSNISIIN